MLRTFKAVQVKEMKESQKRDVELSLSIKESVERAIKYYIFNGAPRPQVAL
jgi:hypothetical protein